MFGAAAAGAEAPKPGNNGGREIDMRRDRVSFVIVFALGLSICLAGPGRGASEEEGRLQDLPIGLTEEEMTRLDEIGLNHMATAPPSAPIRRCAQWEPTTGALIRYNYGFGIPVDMVREFAEDLTVHILCTAEQQASCSTYLSSNGVNMANVTYLDIETNSMWTRDYGPQGIFTDGVWGIVDHIYNRPRPLDDQVNYELGSEWGCSVYATDVIHTGGNFLYDGHGAGFSTDLVWDENPGLTHTEIAQAMEDYLGITNYVVLPDISSSGIHHIDCWMKLLSEETILVKQVSSSHPHYDDLEDNVATLETLTSCYGRPYNIVRVFCGNIGGGEVAAYTNSIILNGKVFVPIFGISTDAAAIETYETAMPGYEVLGYTGSWYSDDAIHCRAMEIHDSYMLMVDTNPIQDREFNTGDYGVTAYIDDRSETGLVGDSLIVYWRLEGDAGFNAVVMTGTAYPDSYYAAIPVQADSVNIEYYVFARDNSGRRAVRPPVAPGGCYVFNTGGEDVAGVADGGACSVPDHLSLAQNTPNPFRISTEIRYELPFDCHVRLDVYNVLGERVAVLADGHRPAGAGTVRWDDVDLPAGVYFCTLDADGQVQKRKMVLLK